MEKIIFAFEDSVANLFAYEQLKFSISIDDAINKIYYVEADLSSCDWMAVLALLEDCKRANLQPILKFGEELINWEDAIAYADEKAANELSELI